MALLELDRGLAPQSRRKLAVAGTRPRILLCTEGTYPYVMGGVSSWCDLIVGGLDEFDWQVLPIVAPGKREALYALPPQAREVGRIEVWSENIPRRTGLRRSTAAAAELPATLVRHLIGWEGDPAEVLDAWIACRRHPADVRRAFRSRRGWTAYLAALAGVLAERIPEAGTPPALDLVEAAQLYQTLYWVARTAAVPTPETDLLHVTAAGWSAIPAVVHKALHGTPIMLTEHGVYLREAYLAQVRSGDSPGARFVATRLARGLTRSAYAGADVVCPVTDANAYWEMGLGIDAERIVVLYNGLRQPGEPTLPPRTKTVVSVGRIDPLKDVHTLLRVAADTLRLVPDAQFLHYGSVSPGEEAYGRSCHALHRRLGLGERFRFMGRTTDPNAAVRAADVVLMTSISEGLPMSILEAMSEARPVVSTGVGGVPDVVTGCGVVTPPGDDHGLAMAAVMLLRNPDLAWSLGQRGHARLGRIFNEAACVDGYRDLLRGMTETTRFREAA
ncbi:GT4 family glycosyltransferase PelF [Solirubrobacter ginsenosidimutans]|uniref:GT4 family glycosyltransferase PelF n=1 Tax=Solirubrobacter ginsenosidimutans TaxID=490573 RepID=A0A9X3S012_9ACTN|nr:GT4 family glycosyltransferase PelF [Solirubrobacter ginsenosidimutans]MDA0161520.1 GT4 family glycosyltransferase PelF [Solirubrobacter ginsenosidimutans]